MGMLSPYLPLPQPIHRSASSPSLRNVYNHRPALDPFLRAGLLPTLVSTPAYRTVIMEEDNEDDSPPLSPVQRQVYLADANVFGLHDTSNDNVHPALLITASNFNQEAMELGDIIRVEHQTMNVGGWVSSVSLEQPGWLVAGIHGWTQHDGEPDLTWGTFQIVTRRKWMSPHVPIGLRCPKRFLIRINRRVQTEPVTGLWGWLVKFMDSSVGM
jgi:hypothetical protein